MAVVISLGCGDLSWTATAITIRLKVRVYLGLA